MKKAYITPETNAYCINTEHQILTASDNVAVGKTYQEDDVVLSRRGGSSLWDDEEDEE